LILHAQDKFCGAKITSFFATIKKYGEISDELPMMSAMMGRGDWLNSTPVSDQS